MSAKAAASPTRILVADDDEDVRQLFVKKLRSAGYKVSEAGSGHGTLDALRKSRFQLLVLDLEMPDLDGFQVLKAARKNWPHLRVLVVSGYMDGALLGAAECLGAAATLGKVQAARSLVSTVQRLLGDDKRQASA
jgi:DNA-binding NtrC family response regulator